MTGRARQVVDGRALRARYLLNSYGTRGAEVLDGRNGRLVAVLGRFVAFQNSALVTRDPDGSVGITVAGYDARDAGTVVHYEMLGSDGRFVTAAGSWPQFHHDPQLSGWARAS
jgi:hypothetical protein